MITNKRLDIELIRIFSAFGIVWFHSKAIGHEFAYSSLIVFVILSSFLSGNQSKPAGWLLIEKRIKRLIVPWAIWFVIYGFINIHRNKPFVSLDNGVVAGILSGTSIHLWYLPFMFGCLLLLDVAKNHLTEKAMAAGSSLAAILMLLSVPCWRQFSIELESPIAQYIHAAAGVFIGIFLLYFRALPNSISTILLGAIIFSAILAIPNEEVGLPYLVGTIICLPLIAIKQPKFAHERLTYLSQCTLGIYLAHVVILSVVAKLLPSPGILLPIITFIVSAVLVFLARKAFPRLANYWS